MVMGKEFHWYENELSLGITQKKYLHDGESSPEDLIKRVGSIFESKNLGEKVMKLMKQGTFFLGGRSLYGAGSKGKFNATMSNCYIMPSPEDSLDSIFDSNKEVSKIFKTGGGIGIDLSTLRPNGSRTNNAARSSTGAVSFMHVYNTTGYIIGFHGRRGATLIGLRISHPDIEEFIDLRKEYDMKAMNISCIVDDDFMNAVENNRDYLLHFVVDATGESISKLVNAKDLFHHICEMNWDYGDPGLLFKGAVDRNNLQRYNNDFHIDICNPCAEYTGPAYNSCNLGSLNLYNFVDDKFTDDAEFNYKKFVEAVDTAVRALDAVLDYGYELQPLDKNREIIDKWRSIGLGFFGYADALIAMGMKYGSELANDFTDTVCEALMTAAINTSSILAHEKAPFGKLNKSAILKSPLVTKLEHYKLIFGGEEILDGKEILNNIKKYGMRNAQLISIAPTGSLALLAGSLSSGIEPIFKCTYERTSHGLEDSNIHFTVADRAIAELLEFHSLDAETTSTEKIKEFFPFVVEADDIDPIKRVEVQSIMQVNIDNAISSTVNLPETATVKDIEKIYMKAYKSNLKGITVFRNNCKRASILGFTSEKCKKDDKPKEDPMNSTEPISRGTKNVLLGATYRKRTACVKALYVTINRDENNNIFEVFTNKSTHGCSANIATITRMTSLALRSGVKVSKVIEELKENTCQACISVMKEHPEYGLSLSCPYAIADALEEEFKKYDSTNSVNTEESNKKRKETFESASGDGSTSIEYDEDALECPECHHKTLIPEGKCVTCKRCGYSKCD